MGRYSNPKRRGQISIAVLNQNRHLCRDEHAWQSCGSFEVAEPAEVPLEEGVAVVYLSTAQMNRLYLGQGPNPIEVSSAIKPPMQLSELKGVRNGSFFTLGQRLFGVEERDGANWNPLLITGNWPRSGS